MIPVPPLVFLDANILFSRTLRDWISLLALDGGGAAFEIRYSEEVLAEWLYRLRRKRPDLSEYATGGQRRNFVNAFPDGLVTGYDPRAVPCPPDPDDRHVLAAAVHGGVDMLVTDDRAAFPSGCVQERFEVMTADEFLEWVAMEHRYLLRSVMDRQLAYFRGRVLVGEIRHELDLIDRLRLAGARRFAERLTIELEIDGSNLAALGE